MPDTHRQPGSWTHRSNQGQYPTGLLPCTADASVGSNNLATIPRAGNVSSDARAGCTG